MALRIRVPRTLDGWSTVAKAVRLDGAPAYKLCGAEWERVLGFLEAPDLQAAVQAFASLGVESLHTHAERFYMAARLRRKYSKWSAELAVCDARDALAESAPMRAAMEQVALHADVTLPAGGLSYISFLRAHENNLLAGPVISAVESDAGDTFAVIVNRLDELLESAVDSAYNIFEQGPIFFSLAHRLADLQRALVASGEDGSGVVGPWWVRASGVREVKAATLEAYNRVMAKSSVKIPIA